MSDAGEGLVDVDSRIQELIEERDQARKRAEAKPIKDPERARALNSLRLAKIDLQRQLAATTHAARRHQIGEAVAELDRRIEALVLASG